jgi:hypothetical protein
MLKYSTINVYFDNNSTSGYPRIYPHCIRITGSDQKEIRRIHDELRSLRIIDREKSDKNEDVIKHDKEPLGAVCVHRDTVNTGKVSASMTIRYLEESEELIVYGGAGHVPMNKYFPYLPNWVENYLLEAGYEPYAVNQSHYDCGDRRQRIQFYKKPRTEE